MSDSECVVVTVVPALRDNYMYIIADVPSGICAVVDPVKPDKILSVCAEKGLEVKTVLTTHSHWDHAGGNKELVEKYASPLEVIGGRGDKIPACTREVVDGDEITLGTVKIEVLFTPCHTEGHVCFFIPKQSGVSVPKVFTGDTLFVGGCGNFNSGTPDQMVEAFSKLNALPSETQVVSHTCYPFIAQPVSACANFSPRCCLHFCLAHPNSTAATSTRSGTFSSRALQTRTT